MNRNDITQAIRQKKSVLCIGLDTDPEKIPNHLFSEPDPVFSFNKAIIDATREFAVAYKINTAFYEAQGIKGWTSLGKTLDYIPKDIFTIADAKRGDIGNTSEQYAKTFFHTFPFDSITVAPYMGADSVQPFLRFPGKWTIVLGLTSNEGSRDFQLRDADGRPLYENVLQTVSGWGSPDNLMFVIGATRREQLRHIRNLLPEHFFLIPGVGTQGGDLDAVCQDAMNADGGILVNVSRGIIYAGNGADFDVRAAESAKEFQQKMAKYL